MQGLMWGASSTVICLLSPWPMKLRYLQFSAAFQHLLHLPALVHALLRSSALPCTLLHSHALHASQSDFPRCVRTCFLCISAVPWSLVSLAHSLYYIFLYLQQKEKE